MSNDWQRLSPWAIVYFAVRGLLGALNTYALVVAGIIAMSQAGFSAPALAVLLFAGLLVLLGGATLYYLNFSFIQEPARFLIRSGVFAKNRTELSFDRIQNISVKEPFYYRAFGLVVLNMDSAGSSGEEVALAALPKQQAQAIQRHIQQYHARQHVADAATDSKNNTANPPAAELLLTRSTSDVVLHGLAHNRAWFILALAAPVLAQLDQPVARWFKTWGVDFSAIVEQVPLVSLALLVLVGVVCVFAVMSLFSVAGAVLALSDLKLFYDAGTYQRSSGLLNRYDIQVKKSRVQTLRFQQNWLDLVFGRLNMVLEPFAAAAAAESRSIMQKIMLPSLTYKQLCDISRHIYPDFAFEQITYNSVHPLYILRALFTLALPAAVIAAVVFAGAELWQWLAPVLAGALVAGASFLRWRGLGVGSTPHYIVVRGGYFGREYFCFATHKVQQVKVQQSLPLKRRGLATLEIVLASRTLQVPLIAESLAMALAQQCLQASAEPGRSWM